MIIVGNGFELDGYVGWFKPSGDERKISKGQYDNFKMEFELLQRKTKEFVDALPEVGSEVLCQDDGDQGLYYDPTENVNWRVGWYKGARVKQRVQH